MMKFGTLPDRGAGALKSVGFEDAGEPSRLRSGALRGAAGGPKLAGGADGPGAGLGLAGFLCFLCFLWCGLPLVVELVWRGPGSPPRWVLRVGAPSPLSGGVGWGGGGRRRRLGRRLRGAGRPRGGRWVGGGSWAGAPRGRGGAGGA